MKIPLKIAGIALAALLVLAACSTRHPHRKKYKRAPCDCPTFGENSGTRGYAPAFFAARLANER
ncbi:MAG: hypothetical protein LBS09_01250 [Bacteroidales bacterium]|jgi:hypothetical protein|nr:hypothetical protein [Bacteroidales bacterium]